MREYNRAKHLESELNRAVEAIKIFKSQNERLVKVVKKLISSPYKEQERDFYDAVKESKALLAEIKPTITSEELS